VSIDHFTFRLAAVAGEIAFSVAALRLFAASFPNMAQPAAAGGGGQ
jgi:hypothetical protein